MSGNTDRVEDLSREDTARLVMDMFHRIIIHYSLWFTEVRHQMGIGIQMKRLSKVLGFQMKDGMPKFLTDMSKESLTELLDSTAVNWLANDGVWFQAVEFESGMNDAKRCNDSCWAHFSPFEAWSIKNFLDLPGNPGLEGLKQALGFRLYARINTQSIIEEGPDSFIFQMNECRVQSARKRKGLADYPCKSVGLVEYPYFARTIDNRITTECIGCPPDEHPQEWHCAWRFSIRAE